MKSLSPSQIQALQAVIERLSAEDSNRLASIIGRAEQVAVEAGPHWDFELSAKRVNEVIGTSHDDTKTHDLRRAMIAQWALGLPDRYAPLNLPEQVLRLYPDWIDYLVDFLNSDAKSYDQDYWAKDVRFALALSVPSSQSHVIDTSSPLGPRQIVKHGLEGRGFNSLIQWVGTRGWRPWLEAHTEARHLSEFSPEGWDKTWAAGAAFLKTHPDYAGMLGSSWFYDPPLETISPRLAYLRKTPMANGAFLVHQGPGLIHSQRASASSPTRKALIDSGEYVPSSWIVAWPRKALIRWAENSGLI